MITERRMQEMATVNLQPIQPSGYFITETDARKIVRANGCDLPRPGYECQVEWVGAKFWLLRTRHEGKTGWWLRPMMEPATGKQDWR